jgi:integrase
VLEECIDRNALCGPGSCHRIYANARRGDGGSASGIAGHNQHDNAGRDNLQQQLGHSELATTQIYAAAISGTRRATVMALEFAAPSMAAT